MYKRLLLPIFFLVAGISSLFAQTVTVNTIEHETISQTQIVVNYTGAGGATGLTFNGGSADITQWTVSINGTPVSVTSVTTGGGFNVTITFDATALNGVPFIMPGQTMTVSYTGLTGPGFLEVKPVAAGNYAPAIVNQPSVNASVFVCSTDLVFFQQGNFAAVQQCAPVLMNFYQFQFKLSLRFRNSTNYSLANIYYAILWGDGASNNVNPYVSDLTGAPNAGYIDNTGSGPGGGPDIVLTTRASHTYPNTITGAAPNECHWILSLTPFVNGVTTCNSLAQTGSFVSYSTDNANSGVLNLPPAVSGTNQVCLGTNVNMQFSDQTLLNCRLAVEGTVPNQLTRSIRIVYGSTSNGAPGNIPDIYVTPPAILGGGPPVQISNDDATGTLTIQPGNPAAGIPVGAYAPTGGSADGNGVITLSSPVTVSTLTTYMSTITTLLTDHQAVGQMFWVRLDYWDICNAYNSSNPLSPVPVSIQNSVQIISQPPALTAAGLSICYTNPSSNAYNFTVGGTTGSTSKINWYNKNPTLGGATAMTNSNGTNSVNFKASDYTAANGAVGAPFVSNNSSGAYYSVWATQVYGATDACESEPIEVVIIQQPSLAANTPAVPTGSASVCNGPPGTLVSYTETTAPPTLTIPATTFSNGSAISLTTQDFWSQGFGAGVTLGTTTGSPVNVTYNIAAQPNPSVTNNISVQLQYQTQSVSIVSPLAAPYTLPTYTIAMQQCTGAAVNEAVTVYGQSSAGTISPTTQTICAGSAITSISLGNAPTVLRGAIQGWQVSVNGGSFVAAGALGVGNPVTPAVPIVGGVQTTYAFQAIVQNGTCTSATSGTSTIIVNPTATASVLSGGATICSGNSTNLIVTVTGGTSPFTVKYFNGSGNVMVNNYVSGTNIPVSPASTTTYSLVSVTDAAGCPSSGLSGTATITISNPTSATLAGATNICPLGTANLTVTVAGGVGATPYAVVYKANGVTQPTINGYVSGANIPVSPGVTTTYVLVSVTDNNGCPALSTLPAAGVTVTVGSSPTAATFSGAGSVCQSVAANLALAITGGVSPYSVTINNGIGTIAGYISGSSIPVPTGTVGITSYSVTAVTDACGTSLPLASITGNPETITVNALPAVANQTPTVCSTAAGGTTAVVDLTAQQAAINGGAVTFAWFTAYNAGTKVFSGPIAAPTTATVTNAIPVYAQVTATATGCVSPATVTYTVNPSPNPPSGATGSTYCSTGSPTPISVTNPGGVLTIDWYAAATGGAVLAGGINSFTPPTAGTYYAQTRNTTTTCISITRTAVVSTEDMDPAAANAGPAQPNLCAGNTTLAAAAATNGGTGTWTSGTGGLTFSNTHSNTSTVSGLPQNAPGGAADPTTLTWTVVSALGVCPSTNSNVVLTVNSLPTAIDPAPPLCEDVAGGGSHIIADMNVYNAAVTSGTTISWFKDIGHTQPLPASPAGPITINNTSQKIVYFQTTSAIGCANSGKVTFTVYGLPVANNESYQLCEDFVGAGKASGINLTTYQTAITGGSANRSVNWYTDAGLTMLIPAGVAAGDNQNFSITGTQTVYAKVIDTSSPVTPQCYNVANVVLNLISRPLNNPILGSATVCSDPNNIQLYQVNPSLNLGSNFTWTVTGVPLNSVQLYAGGGTNSGNFFVLLKFPNQGTVTLTMYETLNGCTGNTSTLTVNVSNAPGAITINGPTSVCAGSSGIVYNVPSPNPSSLYTWTVGGATVVGPSSGIGLSSITIDYGVVTPVTIQVAETSTSGCVGAPASITANLSSVPAMTSSSTSTVCSGSTPSLVFSSSPAGSTFSWTVSSITGAITGTSVGSTGSGNLGTTFTGAAALKNTTGAVGSVTFNVTATATASPNCVGTSQSVVLTVDPEPVLVNPQTKTICSGQAVNYEILLTPLNLPGGTVFNWPKPTMSDASNQGSAGVNVADGPAGTIHITDVLNNTSALPITATYSITPTSGLGCTGATVPVVVTVDPQPILSSTLNATVCSQTSISLVLATAVGSVAASNYNVTSVSIPGGLVAGGTNASVPNNGVASNYLANDTYANYSSGTLNVTYMVAPVSGSGCVGASVPITMTISPEPVLATGLSASVCSGVPSGINLNTKGTSVPAPTYNIVGKTVAVGLVGGGGNANIPAMGVAANYIANDVYTNTGNASLTVVYQIVPVSATGCVGSPPVPVTLTVLPQPVVSTGLNASVCSRSVTGLVLNTNGTSVAAATYSVTSEIIAGGLTASGSNAVVPSAGQVSSTYLTNDSFTNTGTSPLSVVYTVVPLSAGGCSGSPQQITITVNPEPVVSPSLNSTVCSHVATSLILNTNGTSVGAANYNITARTISPGLTANIANVAVPASGVAANYLANDIFTNTGSLPLTVTYTVVGVSSSSCSSISKVITITINPEPVVSSTLNATVCSELPIGLTLATNGSSVAAANYNVTAVSVQGGLTAGGGNATIPATGVAAGYLTNDSYTNSSGSVALTVTYTVVPVSAAGCLGGSQTITITVNPESDLSTTLNSTACSEVATGLTLNTNGTSVGAANYSVTAITIPAGLTPAGTNAVVANNVASNYLANDKFTNVGPTALSVQYTVVANSAAGCPGPSGIATVTINPEPVLSSALSATVCSDVGIGLVLNTNGSSVTAANYNITARSIGVGLTPAGTNVSVPASGVTANYLSSDAFSNTTTLPIAVTYTVSPVSGANCVGGAQVITMTINPQPVVSTTLNTTACSDVATGLILNTNGTSVAALNYNITSITVAPGLTALGSNATVPFTGVASNYLQNDQFTNTGTAQLTVMYTVVPVSAAGCSGNPQVVTVTVNPQPVVSTTLNATVCSEAAISLVLNTNGTSVAAANYNISSRTAQAGLTGAGTNVLVPATSVAAAYLSGDKFTNTTAGPLTVSYVVVPVSGAGCLGNPVPIVITINPEPVLSSSLNLTQCSHVATGLILNTNGTSVAAQNYNITSVTIAGGLTAAGTNAAFPASGVNGNYLANDIFTNTGSSPLTVVYAVVPVSASGCLGVSVNVTVTINPEPVVSTTLNTTVCSEVAIGLTLNTNGTSVAAANYNVISILVPGALVAGGGNAVAANGVAANYLSNDVYTNTTGSPLNVTYTVVAVSAPGCLGSSQNITVAINPEPVVASGLDATVCSETATGLTLNTNGSSVAAATYNITSRIIDPALTAAASNVNVPANGVAANYLSGDKFTNTGATPKTVVYTVVPVSAANCLGVSKMITMTINPEPVTASGLDASVCSHLPIGLTLNTNGTSVAAASYTIVSRTPALALVANGGNVAVPSSGVAANYLAGDIFTNTTAGPLTVVYVVEPVSAASCSGVQKTITMTINPEPVISSTLNATICSRASTGLVLATNGTSVGASTYNVTAISVAPGLIAAGGNAVVANGVVVNYLANDKFTNTGASSLNVVYTVVAVSAGGCKGSPFNITITVNPEPVVATTLNTTVCSEAATGLTLATNGTSIAAATYNITTITAAAGLTPAAGNAPVANGVAANYLASDQFTNTGAGQLNVQYTVVPVSAAGCAGNSQIITVTINPEPVVGSGLNKVVCSDAAGGLTLNTNGTSVVAANYNITSVTVPAGLTVVTAASEPASGVASNYLANDTYKNTGNASLDVLYSVVPVSAAGCAGQPLIVHQTVNPQPVLGSLNETVCSNTPLSLVLTTNGTSVGAATNNVTSVTIPGGLTAAGTNAAIPGTGVNSVYLLNDQYTNNGTIPLIVQYTIVPVSSTPCQGDAVVVMVTINPAPVMSATLNTTVCSELVSGIVLATNGTSVAANNYNVTNILVQGGLVSKAGNATVANGVSSTYLSNDSFTNTTGNPLTVTYTVTPVSASGCQGTPLNVILTVNPEPVIDPSLSQETICSHSITNITLNTNGVSVVASSFSISVVSQDAGLTGVATTGTGLAATAIQNDNFVNVTSIPLKVVYQIIPQSAAGCQGSPFTITITVNPEPVVNPGLDNTVCSRDISGIILSTNGTSVAANSYTLVNVTVPGTITANPANATIGSTSGLDLIKNDSYTNTTSGAVVVVYEIQGVSPTSCAGQSQLINLTINPEPILAPGTASLCSDIPSGIILGPAAGSAPITQYTLKSILKAAALVAGPSNAGLGTYNTNNFLAGDQFTNTTSGPLTVTYTVAALATGCVGADQTIVFTVNPAPAVASNLDATVCSTAASGIVFATQTSPLSTPAASYNIVTVVISAGLTQTDGGSGSRTGVAATEIKNDKFSNPGNNPLTVTYTVQAVSGPGCLGPQQNIVLTVEPAITAAPVNNKPDICSNDVTNILLSSPTVPTSGTISFNYTAVSSVGGLISGFTPAASSIPNNSTIADNLINTSSGQATVTYSVTAVANGASNGSGCTGTPVNVVVIVEPKPQLKTAPPFQTVCEGSPTKIDLTSTTVPSSGTIQFNVLDTVTTGGLTRTSATVSSYTNGQFIADTWSNPDTEQDTVTYALQPVINGGLGCKGDTVFIPVYVNPLPNLTPVPSTAICSTSGIDITLTYDVPSTINKWTTSIISGTVKGAGPGSGDEIFQTLTNNDSIPGVVQYTITPKANNCTGPQQTFDVTVNPIPNLIAPINKTVCFGNNLSVPLRSSVAGATFAWNVASNSSGATGGSGSVINQALPNANGDYLTYSIMVTGPAATLCQPLDSATLNVTAAPQIVPSFLNSENWICAGTIDFLQVQLIGQAPFTFTYSVNGVAQPTITKAANVKSIKIEPTQTSIYEILSVKDAYGCPLNPTAPATFLASDTINVSNVTASFTFSPPNTTTPPSPVLTGGNSIVTFTNTSVSVPPNDPNIVYTWNFGENASPDSVTGFGPFMVDYSAQGPKQINLTATNIGAANAGVTCQSQVTQTLTIKVAPLYAAFTAVPPKACYIPNQTNITVTSNTSTGDVMQWTLSEITPGGSANFVQSSADSLPQFQISESGLYTLGLKTLNSQTGQSATAANQTFEVYNSPQAQFVVQPVVVYIPNTVLTTINNTIPLIDSTSSTTYFWDFGETGATSTQTAPQYTYKLPGRDTIKLTAENDHGGGIICKTTAYQIIIAKQGGISRLPNAFTPNLSGPTGGVSVSGSNYDVFLPIVKGVEEYSLQIYDRWGSLIFESTNVNIGWDGYKDGKLLPGGVYIYKLTMRLSDGERTTQIGDVTMIR